MAIIRYICLSDLHLGGETSLLTNLKHTRVSAEFGANININASANLKPNTKPNNEFAGEEVANLTTDLDYNLASQDSPSLTSKNSNNSKYLKNQNGENNPNIDYENPSPVLVALADCLKSLVRSNAEHNLPNKDNAEVTETASNTKPTLILCGDTLEFALATDSQGVMVFRQLLEQIMPQGEELFGEIIYIPGNHDHHIWETTREKQYSKYIEKTYRESKSEYTEIKPPWYATGMFFREDRKSVVADLPTTVINSLPHLKDFKIRAMYPNFGILSDDKQKCVVFHHGHFTEFYYTLMSQLKIMLFPDQIYPDQVWDLESENHAWIDFLWSMLGRSGDVGIDMCRMYDGRDNKKFVQSIIDDFSMSTATIIEKRTDLNLSPAIEFIEHFAKIDEFQRKILAWAISKALQSGMKSLEGMERNDTTALSDESREELRKYIEIFVHNQFISHENTHQLKEIPNEVTFIFGHTHKPLEEVHNYTFKQNSEPESDLPEIKEFDANSKSYSREVKVFNTGGWISEGPEARPIIGASMVCIDEDFDAVAIRMYSDLEDLGKYKVYPVEAQKTTTGKDAAETPLFLAIEKIISSDNDPWQNFSQVVSHEINLRRYERQKAAGESDTLGQKHLIF
jgi:UDP-2,3-diacylglucosamine pyrophosphatase LpxH